MQLRPYQNDLDLKSNMDRFIDVPPMVAAKYLGDLKSNMDRFIGQLCKTRNA